jgi:hypothetical protein
MAHETPDIGGFFIQVRAALKPGGMCMVVEPRLHVTAGEFEREVELAREGGLLVADAPPVRLSRAVLLVRE